MKTNTLKAVKTTAKYTVSQKHTNFLKRYSSKL